MANNSKPSEVSATYSFDLNYMETGKHSVALFLPEEYHAPIGLIVAHWGNFEIAFDMCLEGLIAGELADGKTRDVSDWKKKPFKKRWKIFNELRVEWLAGWNTTAADKLWRVLQVSSGLHSRRNLIAHGIYGYTIPAKSAVAIDCFARNLETDDRLFFDLDVLKKLYHDISHCTAELIIVFQSIGKVEGLFPIIPDAEVLRSYRETVHPWNPNPNKRSG